MFSISSFLIGFVIAGIYGWILQNIAATDRAVNAPDLAFDRFPDAAHPELTSRGVMNTANAACLQRIFWVLVLGVAIGATVYLANWIYTNWEIFFFVPPACS